MKLLFSFILVALLFNTSEVLLAQPDKVRAGNALDFNGTGNYVDLNAKVMPVGKKTITAWFKTSNTSSNIIYGDCACTGGENGTSLDIRNDGDLFFSGRAGSCNFHFRFQVAGNYNDGKWHFIAAIWDNTINTNGVKLYLDGALVGETTANSTATTVSSFNGKIGICASSNSNPFDGRIDEVTIWNRVLTPSEIQEYMCQKLSGNEPGLVGYWRFDEGQGNTAKDSSTNNNDGTLN